MGGVKNRSDGPMHDGLTASMIGGVRMDGNSARPGRKAGGRSSGFMVTPLPLEPPLALPKPFS